jgi:hypothetical protein
MKPITIQLTFTSFGIDCNHPFSTATWWNIFPPFLLSDKNNSTRIMKFTHIGRQPTYSKYVSKKTNNGFHLFILLWKTYSQNHLTNLVDHMCAYRMTKNLRHNWWMLYRWHSVSNLVVYRPCKNKYPRHILMVVSHQYVVGSHHWYN